MIDLTKHALPDTIRIEGKAFRINTDYRVWLLFGVEIQKKGCTLADIAFVFADEVPQCDFYEELLKFYANPNSTPKQDGDEGEKLVDYIEDGEYIYASFMQDYGIDLLETDMHWHKFKALFAGLREDTKIKQIMQFRGYEKSNKTMDETYRHLKDIWTLSIITEEDLELLEYVNSL